MNRIEPIEGESIFGTHHMLAFSCIAIGIVCLAAIARRAVVNSQTNAAIFMTKKAMLALSRQLRKPAD